MSRLDPSLIRSFPVFRCLDDDTLRAILAEAVTRRIAKGTAMFEHGADAREFFVVLDGRLKVVQVTPDGEQVLIRFVVPGEVCGVAVAIGRPDYPATAMAVADSLALVWNSARWPALCELAPALAVNTMHTVGQRLQDAHARIREISTEEVQRRVAHAVLRLARQAGRKVEDGVLIDFPVTRQDLAEMTGTTLHTVSRIMSAWDAAGLVEGGRQRLLLRDPHKLLLVAEGTASLQ
ncbi:Crp/Fnr family transcriptional regulator [Mangrovicella endophytica]|uniref:Crp/Fnr family transcriptional regulator n=1 Tax=Mangrovicella endophytica TaxID=2066697 RepID=UPI000C9E0AA8|nr:Crp/Fnr family transcriptional regulator [Mangrovicella endophytica]